MFFDSLLLTYFAIQVYFIIALDLLCDQFFQLFLMLALPMLLGIEDPCDSI